MGQDAACEHTPEPHFYGGQAVIEGVMMRGTDKYAVAVRRADGEIVLGEKAIQSYGDKYPWAKWPFVRGNVALFESLTLGFSALQWSADVAAQEEREKTRGHKPEAEEGTSSQRPEPDGLAPWAVGLTMLAGTALALGLFVLLPTLMVDWAMGGKGTPLSYGASVVRNLVEGGLRLVVVVLYVLTISLMGYVRRVFQFHGAEHATINCFEAGETVTPENCQRYGPLHPRCGTAFLLVVIVVKIILGSFFGWPVPWLRSVIRLALLPVVAGIAYEIIRWAGRHRTSPLARLLAAPGMLMQLLTTRKPDLSQIQVAIYALAAVAPEVSLPPGWPPARLLPIPLSANTEPKREAETAAGPTETQ